MFFSEEGEDEDGVRMMVTCGKLTLSPSQWQSGELSDNPEDLETETYNSEKATEETFSRSVKDKLKDLKETVKDEGTEDNAGQYQVKPCNIFIQIVLFVILAYSIFEQIFWFIQCSSLQDEYAEEMGFSDVIEGFVQLSRLSNIPLRQ